MVCVTLRFGCGFWPVRGGREEALEQVRLALLLLVCLASVGQRYVGRSEYALERAEAGSGWGGWAGDISYFHTEYVMEMRRRQVGHTKQGVPDRFWITEELRGLRSETNQICLWVDNDGKENFRKKREGRIRNILAVVSWDTVEEHRDRASTSRLNTTYKSGVWQTNKVLIIICGAHSQCRDPPLWFASVGDDVVKHTTHFVS